MVLITGSIISGDKFNSLLKLNENKDYFKLIGNYDNSELNEWEKLYVNALILNLKSKNKESNDLITKLFDNYSVSIDDSAKTETLRDQNEKFCEYVQL